MPTAREQGGGAHQPRWARCGRSNLQQRIPTSAHWYVRRDALVYREQYLFYLNPHNLDRFGFNRLVGGVHHLCYAAADFLQ